MDVERTLTANPLTEALYEMVGARHGLNGLAASPDPLIRVDFDEEASANVAAFQIGDSQCGRSRGLFGAVDRLSERGQRVGRGSARHSAARQKRTPIGLH